MPSWLGKKSASPITKRRKVSVSGKFQKRARRVPAHRPLWSCRARPGMSKVAIFGQTKNPSLIVVALHALGDYIGEPTLADVEKCTRGLKGAMMVVPQAPEIATWCNPKDPRYDWLRQRGTQDTSDPEANKAEVQRVVRARLRQLNLWLDRLLARHRLTNSELILVGYSQGTILASILGARRGVLGVGLCGGVPNQGVYDAALGSDLGGWRGWWFGFDELIPESCKLARRLPEFCIVNGTKDGCVSKTRNEAMFADFPTTWHWEEGVGHSFNSKWWAWINRWMLKLVNSWDQGNRFSANRTDDDHPKKYNQKRVHIHSSKKLTRKMKMTAL